MPSTRPVTAIPFVAGAGFARPAAPKMMASAPSNNPIRMPRSGIQLRTKPTMPNTPPAVPAPFDESVLGAEYVGGPGIGCVASAVVDSDCVRGCDQPGG